MAVNVVDRFHAAHVLIWQSANTCMYTYILWPYLPDILSLSYSLFMHVEGLMVTTAMCYTWSVDTEACRLFGLCTCSNHFVVYASVHWLSQIFSP